MVGTMSLNIKPDDLAILKDEMATSECERCQVLYEKLAEARQQIEAQRMELIVAQVMAWSLMSKLGMDNDTQFDVVIRDPQRKP
jgi:hypothetical protein